MFARNRFEALGPPTWADLGSGDGTFSSRHGRSAGRWNPDGQFAPLCAELLAEASAGRD